MANDGTVKIGTELDESGLKKGLSGVGDLTKKGLQAVTGVAAAGTAAFGAVTKAALDSVSSLEQNIGGVETLFKENADTVIENAKRAYKTAGMSANEYMSSVTSFSASLLQSLSNDTDAAAKVADMAMTDMSDNANKMGTSMESIQNAYQGFAKQNYTMLDNLKLGYGGTKTEMQRLLTDAQKLSGVEYNIDNLSDVYSAIHVIQEELGITGTTAKEAASTIEGSMTSAKAAWDNFLSGSGTAEELVESLLTAAGVIFENLSEIIPRLAETIPAAAGLIAEAVGENLPQFAEFGLQMIENLLGSITTSLPQAFEKGSEILVQFQNAIATRLPELIQTGGQILSNLLTGLIQNMPQIISQANTMITGWCSAIGGTIPTIISTGTELIRNLLSALVDNAPQILEQAKEMLTSWIGNILDQLPEILETGKNLILELLEGLANNAPKIITQAGEMIGDFLYEIITHLPDILAAGTKIILEILTGMIEAIPKLIGKIPSMISDIGSSFLEKDWSSVGNNIINGIKGGIAAAAGGLIDAAVNAAKNAIETVKNWLGIHSPSRRARDEIGVNMIAGMGEGVEEETPELEKTSEESARRAVRALKKGSASEFVSDMQETAYRRASDNEMSARSKYQNNGYEPDDPDDKGDIYIYNQFDVDGKPLVNDVVKKTKKEISKEQKKRNTAKGERN